MITATLKKGIVKMARQSVREAVRAEMMHVRASVLPFVSTSEQSEIVKKYKRPLHESVRRVNVCI